MIPTGLIESPDGQDLKWLYFDYLYAGEIREDLTIRNGATTINLDMAGTQDIDKVNWVAVLDDGSVYARTFEPSDLNNIGEFSVDDSVYLFDGSFEHDSETLFTDTITSLCYQVLLYSYHFKDFKEIETQSFSQVKGFGNNTSNAKRRPLWIGKHYSVKRSNRINASGKQRNYKIKVGYRRGHWRSQPIGTRANPQTKEIWIEPTIVNYPSE
ncbi:MAG: hypothetical protein QNJ54_06845 [Prochloraceae cyanobacterium]|nr:hypothetical protein [Prochloraceae cyanobacterium]